MGGRRLPKVDHDVLELVDRASTRLKAMGFERVSVSMRTEALYFSYQGRRALLRVSAHKARRTPIGMGPVVARLTFHGNEFDGHSVLRCSPEKIDAMIHIAVGQYMDRSLAEQPSEYRGKRGTWEHLPAPTQGRQG